MKTVAIMALYCVAYASRYALQPPGNFAQRVDEFKGFHRFDDRR